MDSVALAADQISANNRAKSKESADMDARLFRIKHLLILREQVRAKLQTNKLEKKIPGHLNSTIYLTYFRSLPSTLTSL